MNKIPTGESLRKRNIAIEDPSCPFCGFDEESSDHLFISCRVTSNSDDVEFIEVFIKCSHIKKCIYIDGKIKKIEKKDKQAKTKKKGKTN